jgi:hypothetical protein
MKKDAGKPATPTLPPELEAAMGTFKVQQKQCSTCIYRKDQGWNLKELEAQVKDERIGFKGHRVCHHSHDTCCRGFWDRHKDAFPLGHIAQRLGLVEFLDVDVDPTETVEDAVRDE